MTPTVPLRVRHFRSGDRHFASSAGCGRPCVHEILDERTIQNSLAHLNFALHRLARQRISPASRATAWAVIRHESSALWEGLVPSCVRRACAESQERPLTITPSAATRNVPWNVAAAGRVVFVKSATTPDLAEIHTPRSSPTLTIAGPDLDAAEHEAELVAGQHRAGGADVWIARSKVDVLHGLEHSTFAHFACHGVGGGTQGAVQLLDGTLRASDVTRCERLPSVIVLSACNAATSGRSSMGGLAEGLVDAGVSTVIAPLAPINDRGTVPFMARLHRHLALGESPAAALAAATADPRGHIDPAAAPFVCLTA